MSAGSPGRLHGPPHSLPQLPAYDAPDALPVFIAVSDEQLSRWVRDGGVIKTAPAVRAWPLLSACPPACPVYTCNPRGRRPIFRSLNFLFEKHLSNALQIIDQGGVFCFVGERSGRRVYQVGRRLGRWAAGGWVISRRTLLLPAPSEGIGAGRNVLHAIQSAHTWCVPACGRRRCRGRASRTATLSSPPTSAPASPSTLTWSPRQRPSMWVGALWGDP